MTQIKSNIRLVNRKTGAVQELLDTGGVMKATYASDLYLDFPASRLLDRMQAGDDLIINLTNGGKITVRDFFAFGRVGDVLADFEVLAIPDTHANDASTPGSDSEPGTGSNPGTVSGTSADGQARADTAGGSNGGSDPDPLMQPNLVTDQPTDAERALQTINAYNGVITVPTTADYRDAGIDGVTAAILPGVNAQLKNVPASMRTLSLIEGFITTTYAALQTINAYHGGNAAPTVTIYSALGVAGVTAANLAGVNAQVAAYANDMLIAADIEGFITAANTALQTINTYTGDNSTYTGDNNAYNGDNNAYTGDNNAYNGDNNAYSGNNKAPTVADYRNAGVNGVSDTNLAGVNAQVAASPNNMLMTADIASFITVADTALEIINAYNGDNKAPTVTDYRNAGVDGVTAANLPGVNAQVANYTNNVLIAADIEGFIIAAEIALETS